MSRKKRKQPHPPWWKNPWNRWEVYNSYETSYLMYFPVYGFPVIVHAVPLSWGLVDPGEFWLAGLTWEESRVKRPHKTVPGSSSWAASIDDLVEKYPALAEMLSSTHYEDEVPGSRRTATCLIFAQDGVWKACLSDRHEQRALWVSAASLLEIFAVLEDALGSDGAVWRDDRVQGAETSRRQNPSKRS